MSLDGTDLVPEAPEPVEATLATAIFCHGLVLHKNRGCWATL
jgi:hypothetical protein